MMSAMAQGGGHQHGHSYARAKSFASINPDPAPVPAPGQVEAPTMYKSFTLVRQREYPNAGRKQKNWSRW